MAAPQSADICEQIQRELSSTEYACSSLEPLSGGTANFMFKGTLIHPLPGGTREVAIKHGKDYIASRPEFQLSTARCRTEEACLTALTGLGPTTSGPYTVQTPKLHYFSPETNTQVQEYLPAALSLKHYALKYFSPPPAPSSPSDSDHNPSRITKPLSLALGRSLGAWLRGFHAWAAQPGQSALRDQLARDEGSMRQLKHYINYVLLVETVAQFPAVLADAKETFEEVREATAAEMAGEVQVIHGDFWTGNALVPDRPLQEREETPVFIVDWEFSQLGVPPLDLGQMVAELYELSLFKSIEEGKWLIEGFAAGYGPVDDEFAFRTALHVGTHLVTFGSRVTGWGSAEQVEQVVGVGKEIILHAWQKDRAWFEAGDLACLFGSS